MRVEKVISLGGEYRLEVTFDTDGVRFYLRGPHDLCEWVCRPGFLGGTNWKLQQVPQAVAQAIQRVAAYKAQVADFEEQVSTGTNLANAVVEVWRELEA